MVGFYQTFGVDEPANCYADIEKADLFLLWGNNMAEAHPVLWSRVANRRLTHQATRIVQLTTHRSSTSNLSDLVIIFKPNTDLAILNFVIREIIHAESQSGIRRRTLYFLCGRYRYRIRTPPN